MLDHLPMTTIRSNSDKQFHSHLCCWQVSELYQPDLQQLVCGSFSEACRIYERV